MSLNRLLLRARTIGALTKQDGDVSPPTIAGDAVFNSRLDDIEFDADKIELPLIVVYTDEDEGTLLNRGAGDGAFNRNITLRIEIAIGTFQKTVVDGKANIQYLLPSTDAELEALLDLFEAQVWRSLRMPGRAASAKWWKLVKRLEGFQSLPDRSIDGNNRLAARRLFLKCAVPNDCLPVVALGQAPNKPPTSPTLADAPWLNPMFEKLAQNEGYKSAIDVLRELDGEATVFLPQLRHFGVKVDVAELDDPKVVALLERKHGPIGPLTLIQQWEIP